MNIYARYNNARKSIFDLVTLVQEDGENFRFYKIANHPNAVDFLKSLPGKKDELEKTTTLQPVFCEYSNGKVWFQSGLGVTFDRLLFDAVTKLNKKSFLEYLELFNGILRENISTKKELSSDFSQFFGEDGVAETWEMMSVGCIDILFDNLFYDKKSMGHALIDYEWVMPFAVPYKYILWRSLFAFYQKNREYGLNSHFIPLTELYQKYDISNEDRDVFIEWEYNFQIYVQKKVASSRTSFSNMVKNLENDLPMHNKVFSKATCEKIALEGRIQDMEQSKFWKLRSSYIHYKKVIFNK